MERKYIMTFEQFINEEGDAPEEVTGAENADEPKDKDPDEVEVEKPDYSEVDPTPTKIMTALNKAGFEINQDDIIKWDGGSDEDDEGDLLVKIDDDEKYFTIDNGILYYQLDSERVLLGKLNNTEDLVMAIKDYFDVQDKEEKKEAEKDKKENGDSTDSADSEIDPELSGEDDIGI